MVSRKARPMISCHVRAARGHRLGLRSMLLQSRLFKVAAPAGKHISGSLNLATVAFYWYVFFQMARLFWKFRLVLQVLIDRATRTVPTICLFSFGVCICDIFIVRLIGFSSEVSLLTIFCLVVDCCPGRFAASCAACHVFVVLMNVFYNIKRCRCL